MTARCVRFLIWALYFLFPYPLPFSSWSRSDVCLYAYTGRTVPTSQMHPVCWNHPLIEYDQKNVLFTQFMREGFQIQLVKLWKSACQPSSSWQESMPSPPKFASFIQQKKAHCLLLLLLNFWMPETVLSSKFGSTVVSEPLLLNRTKSYNVSRIAQSDHLFLSIIVGLPHISCSPTM